jgi:hypothetical protein
VGTRGEKGASGIDIQTDEEQQYNVTQTGQCPEVKKGTVMWIKLYA